MAVANAMTQGRREKVLDRLNEGDATTRELESLCGVRRSALRHLLGDLQRKNEITVKRSGTRSSPAVYSRVNEDKQKAEGVPTPRRRRAKRAAAPKPEQPSSSLRGRYLDFLAREHPARLVELMLEGKIEATEEVFKTTEKVVLGIN